MVWITLGAIILLGVAALIILAACHASGLADDCSERSYKLEGVGDKDGDNEIR